MLSRCIVLHVNWVSVSVLLPSLIFLPLLPPSFSPSSLPLPSALLLPPHSPPSPPQEEASLASPSRDGADLPDDIANRMSLLLCQPHPHVEHTQWGNIKVARRGAVCGCGCGCVWGVVEMLQEVQCGSICWGECHSCCKKWRGNVNVKPDSVFNYSCLHCRVAKTQLFKVTSGMYSDMLSSLP